MICVSEFECQQASNLTGVHQAIKKQLTCLQCVCVCVHIHTHASVSVCMNNTLGAVGFIKAVMDEGYYIMK